MIRTKRKVKKFLPESYAILAELAEAARLFEMACNAGLNMKRGLVEYEAAAEAAEAKLDALALVNPEEATRIFSASPYFDEAVDPDEELYFGHGLFVSREEYAEYYGTVEARAALLREYLD